MRTTTIALVLCAGAGSAHANGFVLNDHGAAATGRADAVVATSGDGSSIVHNVGGIAGMEGLNIFLGASLIFPKASFECTSPSCAGTTTDTESPMAVTPQFYATYRINSMFAAGIGFHTPFGSKIVWPDNGPTTDEIQNQSLRTFFITPAVAVNLDKIVPGLRFGAGLDIVPATVEITRDIPFGTDVFGTPVVGTAHLGGTGLGFGGRFGLQYTPRMAPRLSFGVAYRSPVTLDLEGNGDFDVADLYRGQLPADGEISTSITLPQSILGGVAVRPIPHLELELDGVWMGWSSYDQLEITLPPGSDPAMTVSPRDYDDTLSIRFGVEYQLRKPLLAIDLRAGYMYDPTPIPSDRLNSTLPDIDRHDLTFGASYHLTKNYAAHFGALWVIPGSHTTSDTPLEPVYKGTYDVTAFVASLSLSGRFGAKDEPPAE